MKKIILTIAFIGSGLMASAQVGVGTENPQTSLHIVGANATDKGTTGTNAPGALSATDGITVPVVTTEMTAPGTPVNGTKVGQLVYSNFAGKTGFYYWDGAAWTKVGGAGAAPQRYEAIRGNYTPVSAASYTVTATDYYIATTGTGTAITIPTSGAGFTAADAGRTIFIFNDNSSNTPNTWSGTIPSGNLLGLANQFRGGVFVWTGTKWIYTGK